MHEAEGRADSAHESPSVTAALPPGRDARRQVPWSYASTREIGRGRSAVVYHGRDAQGRALACKVFGSEGLTKVVQLIFLGAPNPYIWSEDAVRCASLRRTILAELVPVWLPGRLRIARSRGVAWHAEQRAFELTTEFVDGRPAELHHPRRMAGADEFAELAHDVMAPLRVRLEAAGFDGLLWQAGEGNPVALNNFLREREGAEARWAWIDLESGVPALFPLDPRALFGFYLPRSWKLRRPLFDDVDVERLRVHLRGPELRSALGSTRCAELLELADQLDRHQRAWKALRRHQGSIAYRLARGQIDADAARWYEAHPLRWYAREGLRAARSTPAHARRLLARGLARLRRIPWFAALSAAPRFLFSQRFRYALGRRHVSRRIHTWEQRGQMNAEDARFLRSHLVPEESSAYLTDFGFHLAMKPFVKSVEYWIVPALFAFGFVGEQTVALVLLTGGAVARSLYTSCRLVQAALNGRERPWIALVVGTLPVVGNFAYPVQLAWSSTERDDDLARFILHDGFARIGARIPIWGGRDTATEHWFNRLPDRLMRVRRRAPLGTD